MSLFLSLFLPLFRLTALALGLLRLGDLGSGLALGVLTGKTVGVVTARAAVRADLAAEEETIVYVF